MIVDRYPWLLEPTLLTTLIRTLLAIICSGVIGYDRDKHGAAAGLRTHILVCVGAMLAMSTGQFAYLQYGAGDPTRIGAQVISGIGFLGAGTIIVVHSRKISGLTTAAGLWASAAIGLALGISYYEGAIIGSITILFTQHALHGLSHAAKRRKMKEDERSVNASDDVKSIAEESQSDDVKSIAEESQSDDVKDVTQGSQTDDLNDIPE